LSIGLSTPINFETSQYLIEETIGNPVEIKFGKNGKPHYVANEFSDNEGIITLLTDKLGVDNFTTE
jgi:hypothetical protein